jgi:HEPN domain-containing protein
MQNNIDPETISKLWFELGENDFRAAKVLFREGESNITIGVLLQQALEKYLKGYLLNKGWTLKKTHDLELLVTEAIVYDKSLQEFLEFSRIISALYLKERYPPSTPLDYPKEEIALYIKQAEMLINIVKEK